MKNNEIKNNQIVSVIIPVFQAEKYVERCVRSVQEQTYEALDIILIDDGSKDNSLEICKGLAEKDGRIRVFRQENKGVAATRNAGLFYATGEFIYFLDSDDWVREDTLARMVAAIGEQHADLCICGFKYIEDQGEEEHCFHTERKIDKSTLMEQYFWKLYENEILFNIGTKLYRRSRIEENNLRFHTDMIIYEDIRFCLEYLDHVQQVSLCGEPFYCYFRGNDNSITRGYKSSFWRSTADYCEILMSRFPERPIPLKKAVLLCLYRAYLQECHHPLLNKDLFCQSISENCFPIAERLELSNSAVSGLKHDQKIFMKLIGLRRLTPLWVVAKIVSLRDKVRQ